MRPAAGLLLLLLVPTASAFAVEIRAPAMAGVGLPFLVEVCAMADAPAQLRVLAEGAALDRREDRYGASFEGARCEDVEVRPEPGAAEVALEARVRPEGGEAKARANASVPLRDAPVASCASGIVRAEGLVLRAPMRDGSALVPAFRGSDACAPAALRIAEARARPREGLLLANDGPGVARLALWRIEGVDLPDVFLRADESVFVPTRVRPGEVALLAGARVVSSFAVPPLAPGEAANATGVFRPGRTDFAPRAFSTEGELLAYATPESSHAPLVALIDEAREEVLVESLTLTSPDVAAALARAADRGLRVRALLDGSPPGGVPPQERALVPTLAARGVDVSLLGGEGARYRTMHAKLVVVDRAAVWVATENLGEATARGFALVLRDAPLARAVAEGIEADLVGFDVARAAFDEAPAEAAPRAGPRVEEPFRQKGARNVTLVLSPDAPWALAEAIRAARASVDVMMLRADAEGPMVEALVAAAREGAAVRVLLDARYDDGTNRETAARLAAFAAREGLAIEARLDRADRVLHAKSFVVDGRVVYVGSMNWVRAAVEENREAGVLVEDEALAAWWTEVFTRDRAGPTEVERGVPAPPVGAWVCSAVIFTLLRRARGPSRSRARGGA